MGLSELPFPVFLQNHSVHNGTSDQLPDDSESKRLVLQSAPIGSGWDAAVFTVLRVQMELEAMQEVCPDCGSRDALNFVAELGQHVCSVCGAVSDEFQAYEPTSIHEVAYALGAPAEHRVPSSSVLAPVGPLGRRFWLNDIEQSRRFSEYIRRPEVQARIQGTLSNLGHPGLFEQVDFLFHTAREASWQEPPPRSLQRDSNRNDATISALDDSTSVLLPTSFAVRRIRWGHDSLLLATACCYAVLRREGVRIDLQAVSCAADLPLSKVKRAFRWLKLLVTDAVRSVKLANPDPYLRQILAFFRLHTASDRPRVLGAKVARFLEPLQCAAPSVEGASNLDPARILINTPFEAVEATALDLCTLWWPRRDSYSTDPQLAAFAIVVVAMEAHVKLPAPIYEIFRYTNQAVQFDPSAHLSRTAVHPKPTGNDPFNKTSIRLHSELCAALKVEASRIPWLSQGSTLPTQGPSKRLLASSTSARSDGSGRTDSLHRRLFINALDIIDVWKAVPSHRSDDMRPSQALDALVEDPTSDVKHASFAMTDAQIVQTSINETSESASNSDVDAGELDCFISTAQAGAPTPLENDANLRKQQAVLREETEIDAWLDDGPGGETWPRIRSRLLEAGIDGASTQNKEEEIDVHLIDLLADDQVDRLLFDGDELNSLLRTDPAELDAFERAKIAAGDWSPRTMGRRDTDPAGHARRVHGQAADDPQADVRKPSASPSASAAAAAVRAPKPGPNRPRPHKEPFIGSSDPSRPLKRARGPTRVSLREQNEESDWSDGP